MLKYDGIEGVNVNKTNRLFKCVICHYWYFLVIHFRIFGGCHDLMQKAMCFNDVAIVSLKRNNYRIHFCYMIIDEAINKMNISDLKEKSGTSWNYKNLLNIKIGKEVIVFGNNEIETHKFHYLKNSISIGDVDVKKIYSPVVSSKVSFDIKGFKYFIGYKDNEKI